MPRLVQHANATVHDEALTSDHRGQRVQTTIVGCALRDAIAVVCHVGDSRCYHVRNRGIRVVTQDHTAVAEQARAGTITPMQAEHSESRHLLRQSLGPELRVSPETGSFGIVAGDVIVLCTDGLYEAIYPEDIVRIVSEEKDPGLLARELVACAVDADGSDNVTAQVIRVRETEAAEREGRLPGKR
jgi:protein phosphatase